MPFIAATDWGQGVYFETPQAAPVTPVDYPQVTNWDSPSSLPRRWSAHLSADASMTSWGHPDTWATLRLVPPYIPLAQALSRQVRPMGAFSGYGSAASQTIPSVFVPAGLAPLKRPQQR